MKIAHFNTFPYGGAATAAKRIHQSLVDQGVDSWFHFFSNEKQVDLEERFQPVDFFIPESRGWGRTIKRRLHKRRRRRIYRLYDTHLANRPADGESYSMAELADPTRIDWNGYHADIAHLHWISFFTDYPSFFRSLPDSVPLVWTLHDMNAFTGGCHYSNGCDRFRAGCGDCPQVNLPSSNDVSRASFQAKQKSLRKRQIHVVTPSVWLSKLAKQSPIFSENTTFDVLHYGLNLEQLRPLEKQMARKQLGIQTDAVLIGFGAEDIHNVRKGGQHLLTAIRKLQSDSSIAPNIECLLFGSGKIEDLDGLPRLHQLGYVDTIEKQRMIYSAADIVVVPSREDNQPQVGLEAMACGTPVVGFRAGGIPEYVRHGITGLTADIGDENQLAHCLERLIRDSELRLNLGSNARLMMEREFESSKQAGRYIKLYQSVFDRCDSVRSNRQAA